MMVVTVSRSAGPAATRAGGLGPLESSQGHLPAQPTPPPDRRWAGGDPAGPPGVRRSGPTQGLDLGRQREPAKGFEVVVDDDLLRRRGRHRRIGQQASKPITAVALMMLVEEGLIGLDDPVHSYIPAWRNLGVYASGMPSLLADAPPSFITAPPLRPMKVVDLATHTSGLTYGFMMRTAVDAAYRQAKVVDRDTPGGLPAMIEQLAQIPLDFSPGTAWNYSVSIDVLGYLVEKLSGMSFGQFLRTRLFEPLGMKDTAFYVPSDKIDALRLLLSARH